MCTLDGCGVNDHLGPPPKATDEDRRLFLKGAVALPLAASHVPLAACRLSGEARVHGGGRQFRQGQ